MKPVVRKLAVLLLAAGLANPGLAQTGGPPIPAESAQPPLAPMPGPVGREAGIEKFASEFENNYRLETRTYPIRNLKPETAKLFVDRLLATYYLLQNYTDKYGDKIPAGIVSSTDLGRAPRQGEVIVKASEETVAHDEKAGVLVVDAIPTTHQSIEQLLERIDGSLTRITNEDAVNHYKLEILLLHTDKSGSRSDSGDLPFLSNPNPFANPHPFAYRFNDLDPINLDAVALPHLKGDPETQHIVGSPVAGKLKELLVKAGDRVPGGAPIARLGGSGADEEESDARFGVSRLPALEREARPANRRQARPGNSEDNDKPEGMPPSARADAEGHAVEERLARVEAADEQVRTERDRVRTPATAIKGSETARIIKMPRGGTIVQILAAPDTQLYEQSPIMRVEFDSAENEQAAVLTPVWVLPNGTAANTSGKNLRLRIASPIAGTIVTKGTPIKEGQDVGDGTVLLTILPDNGSGARELRMKGTGHIVKVLAAPKAYVTRKSNLFEIELDSDTTKKVSEELALAAAYSASVDANAGEEVHIDLPGFQLRVNGDKVLMKAGETVNSKSDPFADSGNKLLDELVLKYKLSDDDRKMLEGGKLEVAGRAIVNIESERGPLGQADVNLGTFQRGNSNTTAMCRIAYQDFRAPYLVLSVNFSPWFDNSVFLEPGKASLLGVTNLREAVVLIVRRIE